MSKKPLTELRDAEIHRVDAVKGPANGTRFLIAKSAAGEAGLVSDDVVRELLADPQAAGEDTYLDAAGTVMKAELSSAEENDLPDSAFAYIEPGGTKDAEGKTVPRGNRHFNINDEAHVRNALARLSQSPFEAKARPKVEAAARRMGIGEPAESVAKGKEHSMTTPAEGTPAAVAEPSLKDARAVLKRAKLAKKTARLAKRALIAKATEATPLRKGTLHNLAEAHLAVLEALKDQEDPEEAKKLQSLADEIASCMGDHAMGESGSMDDEMDGEGGDDMIEKGKPATPVSLKKARQAAKAARLAKRAARDEIALAKARKTLAKIGRRNSAADQLHVDAIDTHAAALGATAHLTTTGTTPTLATSVPADLAKATDDQVAGVIELIQKAVGPMLGQDLEAIRGELTQQSEQIAKIARMPMPGGPRVVLERDGSIIAAPDGERGLTPEQAMLAKMAERFPVGSVAREEIQKEAAKSAIKDLMVANHQY